MVMCQGVAGYMQTHLTLWLSIYDLNIGHVTLGILYGLARTLQRQCKYNTGLPDTWSH